MNRIRVCSGVAALLAFIVTACASTTSGGLHVDDGGRGAALPVVFVHGNGGSSAQWRAQLDHQLVVLRIRNLRIVERVVAIIVAIQSFAENPRARRCALARTRCFLRTHLEPDSFPYLAGSAA